MAGAVARRFDSMLNAHIDSVSSTGCVRYPGTRPQLCGAVHEVNRCTLDVGRRTVELLRSVGSPKRLWTDRVT